MQNVQKLLLSLILVAVTFVVWSQTNLESKYVHKTFRGTRLINTQTVEAIPEHAFDFYIQHRFGEANFKDDFFKDFFGLDGTANIRFGFAVPISRRLMIGVGRTKYQKTFDFEGKYIFLKQTKDDRMPISLALYGAAYVRTDDMSEMPDSLMKSSYRWSYSTQLIISRKFNDWLSLQVNPTWVHKNITDFGAENNVFAMPVAGKIKTTMFSSLIFEYGHVFNKPEFSESNKQVNNTFAIAWEYQTASHMFEVVVGNSFHILDHNHYTTPYKTNEFWDGKFYLGFNMSRTFWVKKQ